MLARRSVRIFQNLLPTLKIGFGKFCLILVLAVISAAMVAFVVTTAHAVVFLTASAFVINEEVDVGSPRSHPSQ